LPYSFLFHCELLYWIVLEQLYLLVPFTYIVRYAVVVCSIIMMFGIGLHIATIFGMIFGIGLHVAAVLLWYLRSGCTSQWILILYMGLVSHYNGIGMYKYGNRVARRIEEDIYYDFSWLLVLYRCCVVNLSIDDIRGPFILLLFLLIVIQVYSQCLVIASSLLLSWPNSLYRP